jgi:hypothetical protein
MNFDDLLENSIYRIALRLSDVETEWMSIAGQTLSKIYGLSNEQVRAYLYDGSYLGDMSSDINKVKRILQKAHENNIQDMVNLYNDITDTVYQEGTSIAVEKGQRLLPLEVFKSTFNPMLNDVMDHYETMAKSTTVNEGYRDTIKHFVNRLTLDDDRINAPTAMRKAIKELTEQGISTVEFESGRKMRMDSAVRSSLMTEYTNIVQNVQDKLGEEIGSDAIEVSSHSHPAPDHSEIQGRIFTLEEWEKLQNGDPARDVDIEKYEAGYADYLGETFQTDRPIGMWNCRHIAYNFILGISTPSHSKEYLDKLEAENEAGIDFHGKHHTLYEAEQEQRRLEVEIRYEKERLNLLNEVKDTDSALHIDYRKSRDRLADLRAEYKQLGETLRPVAMRMKPERASIPRGSTGDKTLPPIQRNLNSGIESDFRANTGMGAMAERFYVKTGMKTVHDRWHIQEGSYISGVKVIAQGTGINDIDRLVRTYHLQNDSLTNEKDWYKVRGTGIVTDNDIERMVELHWYQCKNIGKVEFKVKRYFN